jgi:hypothetical protein
MGRKQVVDGQK